MAGLIRPLRVNKAAILDLNNISDTGIYILERGTTNYPEDSVAHGGFVLNLVWNIDTKHQLFVGNEGLNVYYRRYNNPNWSEWKSL